jgi:hypothetical protein
VALIVEDGTGLSNAESYLSVADADSYFETMRGDESTYAADWGAVSTTTAIKEACLRWATRLIDRHWAFDGEKSTTTQKLRWPRSYVEDIEGDEIDGDIIPEDLQHATAEMARALLVDPERVEDQEVGLSSLSVAVIQLAFDKYDRAGTLPGPVKRLLSSFGTLRGGGQGRSVERA